MFLPVVSLIFLCLIIFIFFIGLRAYRLQTFFKRQGIKHVPFIKNYEFLLKPINRVDFDNFQKYGKIYAYFDNLKSPCLMVNEPELIRDILIKDFDVFYDHRDIFLGKVFDKNIFTRPADDVWKRIRSLTSSNVFNPMTLKAFNNYLQQLSLQLNANIEKCSNTGKPFDMMHYIEAFIYDATAVFAFRIKTDSINDENHIIFKFAKDLNKMSVERFFCYFTPPLARFLRLNLVDKEITDYFQSLVRGIKNLRRNEDDSEINAFNALLEFVTDDVNDGEQKTINNNNNNNGCFITHEELEANSAGFMIVGLHTTVSALCHCIYHLSQNPDCQQKLFEELESVNQFDSETLSSLKYLNACINETLRISPSFNRLERVNVKDYKFRNFDITIPKGTTVSISLQSLHHNPENFQNPEEFNPERFMGQRDYKKYAYLPWGAGPRICLGLRYATEQMRVCLARLVKHFRFVPSNDFKVNEILIFYNNQMINAFPFCSVASL